MHIQKVIIPQQLYYQIFQWIVILFLVNPSKPWGQQDSVKLVNWSKNHWCQVDKKSRREWERKSAGQCLLSVLNLLSFLFSRRVFLLPCPKFLLCAHSSLWQDLPIPPPPWRGDPRCSSHFLFVCTGDIERSRPAIHRRQINHHGYGVLTGTVTPGLACLRYTQDSAPGLVFTKHSYPGY